MKIWWGPWDFGVFKWAGEGYKSGSIHLYYFFVVLVLLCFYLNERTKVSCSGADPVTHRTDLWF